MYFPQFCLFTSFCWHKATGARTLGNRQERNPIPFKFLSKILSGFCPKTHHVLGEAFQGEKKREERGGEERGGGKEKKKEKEREKEKEKKKKEERRKERKETQSLNLPVAVSPLLRCIIGTQMRLRWVTAAHQTHYAEIQPFKGFGFNFYINRTVTKR